jgi:hypothetical protein
MVDVDGVAIFFAEKTSDTFFSPISKSLDNPSK